MLDCWDYIPHKSNFLTPAMPPATAVKAHRYLVARTEPCCKNPLSENYWNPAGFQAPSFRWGLLTSRTCLQQQIGVRNSQGNSICDRETGQLRSESDKRAAAACRGLFPNQSTVNKIGGFPGWATTLFLFLTSAPCAVSWFWQKHRPSRPSTTKLCIAPGLTNAGKTAASSLTTRSTVKFFLSTEQ